MALDRDICRQIESILDRFDFEKVHSVMHFLNWEWGDVDPLTKKIVNLRIPGKDEIECLAHRLLLEAAEDDKDISSGGLEAYIFFEEDERRIGLRFVLEEKE